MSKTRSIFEDVGEEAPKQPDIKSHDDNPSAVRLWLWLVFALVSAMIIIGGLTRLTDSGLSITEWDLIMGIFPPMGEAAWSMFFAKYQTTQEFQLQNADMTLAEFKGIFWWEWGHRFLGRVTGLVWIIGFLWFYLRKEIRRDRLRSIFTSGILIGIQGVIGIWMVYSGYHGANTDVESYRLATHLGMAFIILGMIYWNIKMLKRSPAELVEARRRGDSRRVGITRILAGLTFLQILLGALVAGIDGGLSYNDWPMMGGEFFSSDAFAMTPFWKNFFENPALVQFFHRMNGYLLVVFALWFWLDTRKASYKEWRFAGFHFAIAILLQMTLGIMLLLHHVPLWEAILHQAFAIGIWILVLGLVISFRHPRAQSLREG